MNSKNKLNINVNKDDNSINDYLYCWAEMDSRPSKTIIYKNFEAQPFIEYFKIHKNIQVIQEDIIPIEDETIVNKRCLFQIEKDTWVSYMHYDYNSEESFIGEVIFYYNSNLNSKIQNHLDAINNFQLKDDFEKETNTNNLFTLNFGQTGLESNSISKSKLDDKNFISHYNDSVLKKINKSIKKIKKSPKGITVIYGDRGSGKTSLINYYCNKVKTKNFYFLPLSLMETSVINLDLRNFLKTNKDSVLIIDDADILLSDPNFIKLSLFTHNLIQLVDGLDSDDFGLNVILIFNVSKETEINQDIIDCNNLADIIKVNWLTKENSQELAKSLNKKIKIKKSTRLIDILKDKLSDEGNQELGF